jgi:hypothetical protein
VLAVLLAPGGGHWTAELRPGRLNKQCAAARPCIIVLNKSNVAKG